MMTIMITLIRVHQLIQLKNHSITPNFLSLKSRFNDVEIYSSISSEDQLTNSDYSGIKRQKKTYLYNCIVFYGCSVIVLHASWLLVLPDLILLFYKTVYLKINMFLQLMQENLLLVKPSL